MQQVNKFWKPLFLALLPVLIITLNHLLPSNIDVRATQTTTDQPTSSQTLHNAYSGERERVREFFRKYKCPLLPYVDRMVDVAIESGLDPFLLPAISFHESTCGKRQLGNNPFGFGYYRFNSFDESILYVGQAISGEGTKDAKHYKKAKKDSFAILRIYNKRPSYATEVLQTMKKMKG